jgi:hypothetical protein
MTRYPLTPLPPAQRLDPKTLALLREVAEALGPLAAPAPVPSHLPEAHRRATAVYPRLTALLQEHGVSMSSPRSRAAGELYCLGE